MAAPNESDRRSCLRKGIHRAGLHPCLWPGTSLAETREEKERDMSLDEKSARRLHYGFVLTAVFYRHDS